MRLWKKAVEQYRERELVITVFELALFAFSFGCTFSPFPLIEGLFTNVERPALTSFIDALYYSMVTIATIGYGDISPHTAAGRIATTYYIISILFWLPSKVA